MTQRATREGRYLSDFERLQQDSFSQDPAWLREVRADAVAHFSQLGFPVARRGNEEWKYTDVGPLARARFQLPAPGPAAYLPHGEVEHEAFAGAQRSRLVFIDGRWSDEHSSIEALPRGVVLCSMAEALRFHGQLLVEHLSRHAEYEAHAFTALNTAFIRDGAFLYVPNSTTVPGAIQLMFLSTGSQEGTAAHPRILVVMDKDSKATLIETHVGPQLSRYFTNVVSEIVLGPGASLRHHRLQRESEQAFHVATDQVVQQRDSSYTSLMVDTGGGLVRNNLSVLLSEPGASARLSGLYLLAGQQHVDYSTFIDHAVPHTGSEELYKGVLDGNARVVFGGKVLVRHGAQQVSSHQTNKTLLLSEGTAVDTKPQLEIYADDVKCGHGAAIGQSDEEALFYLKSRGLSDSGARELLTYGFVSEVLSGIADVPFRAYLEQRVHSRLHEALSR